MKIILDEVHGDIRKLDKALQSEVRMWLKKLGNNPYLGQTLTRELNGLRKIYFNQAKHRIVYFIREDKLVIVVVAIASRNESEVYKLAKIRMNKMLKKGKW